MTTTLIYHEGTGTIINAQECVFVDVPDTVEFSGDDYFDDAIIEQLADEVGRPVIDHWARRLESLGILKQVEDFVVSLCEDLDIDIHNDPF